MRSIWVGVGGFAGAIARYHLERVVAGLAKGPVPWGTLAVNLSGCFLLGLLATRLVAPGVSPILRSAISAGFLGAYTTFSAFAYQTLRLGQAGRPGVVLLNVALSVLGGLAAVWVGSWAARAW